MVGKETRVDMNPSEIGKQHWVALTKPVLLLGDIDVFLLYFLSAIMAIQMI